VVRLKVNDSRKQILTRSARAAQRFPEILPALADGRLHLTAVVLLAPCLTQANAGELLAEAEHQTKAAIKDLLARRFPGTEHLPLITATTESLAPVTGGELVPEPVPTPSPQLVPEPVAVVQPVATSRPKSTVAPLAAERFALHLSMGQSLRDKLRRAQELLGHQIPSGDLAAVLERALDALIPQLEKKKFAATTRPTNPRQTTSPRTIPANVKRAVRDRDKGQCTFVSESGRRCEARSPIEYDHIVPVARGGRSTVDNLRLRCRAHNQYAAEQAFGRTFMEHARSEKRRAATPPARGAAPARGCALPA